MQNNGGLDVRSVRLPGSRLVRRRVPRENRQRDLVRRVGMEALRHISVHGGRSADGSRARRSRRRTRHGARRRLRLVARVGAGSHGRRQPAWCRGSREWAGLHVERTDDEIIAEDRGGEDVMVIPTESWPCVRAEAADLHDPVELHGLDGAARWMASRGLRRSVSCRGAIPGPGSPTSVRAAADLRSGLESARWAYDGRTPSGDERATGRSLEPGAAGPSPCGPLADDPET